VTVEEFKAKRAAYSRKFYGRHREQCLARIRAYRQRERDSIKRTKHSYYESHRESILIAKRLRESRDPELNRVRCKSSYKRNRSKRIVAMKQYRASNWDKINAYYRSHRRKPYVAARHSISNRIRQTLKGQSKSSNTIKLLGCSIKHFKMYLESLFEHGMSWDNYGSHWHIDHIIPCAIFDLSKPEHQARCFHFSNLQPLLAADNLAKGCKLTDTQFKLL
jgi:hypothetical protein